MVLVNKNIILLLLNFFIFFSCSDEELINPYKDIEEGIPVTASLSFSSSNTVKVETKASDIADNNPVNTLAILIFKKTAGGSEKIGETKFCTKDEIAAKSIKVATTSGSRYVYAVANYKSSLFDLETQLTDITTLDDLKGLSVELPEKNISVLDNQFLMSGAFVGKVSDDEGLCVIGTDGMIKNKDAGGKSGTIDLKRIMASIKFNISCETTGATFVADSWQVKNVPQQSFVIEQTSGDYPGEKDDYFQSKLNTG
ncbi:fimbrial protein, partial [uncultured Parabacteroides sp.]|uniref:fimbrial protein n=1 Tax=uncultured Parabacteroides sp. TaxID=512312 RepID=UPI0025940378